MLTSSAFSAPVILGEHASVVSLTDALDVLEDPDNDINSNQVTTRKISRQFRPNKEHTVTFGYPKGSLWLRFTVAIQSPRSWYLVNDLTVGGDIALFVLPVGTSPALGNPTLFQPIRNYRTPAWKLDLPTGHSYTLYLHANNGQVDLRLPLKLMTANAFISHTVEQYTFFALVFGGLTALSLYNLILAIWLGEASYLSLAGFILTTQLVLFRDSNLFPSLAFLNNAHSGFYTMPLLLMTASGMRFWRYINQGGGYALDQLMKWLQWGALFLLPFAGWIPLQFLFLGITLLLPVLTLMISQVAIQGHKPTRKALLAGLTFLSSSFLYVLTHLGWITSASVNNAFITIGQAGIFSAVLLLSISHASNSRELRSAMERERIRNQAKDEFLTTMSHELRTPMNAVMATGELLRQTSLDHEQKRYLQQQETAAHHMLTLIDDILDLSRLENDSLLLRREPFNLNHTLDDLRHIIVSKAQTAGILLLLPEKNHCHPCLLGDHRALSQILINLLGNAIKFTPQGEIELIIKETEVLATGHSRLYFEVRDTGIGIAEEAQQQLFKPFVQLNSGRSRHYQGSGLGLAISQKLVAMMGGTLELDSKPEHGSRFFFTLKFQHCQRATTETKPDADSRPPQPAIAPLQGKRILVVEDDSLNQFIIDKLLGKLGIVVTLAESGESALRILQQAPAFDLLFMDISMPGMDGYETTRKIRHSPAFRGLPIIALTAHTISGERERCLASGMNDFLSKPLEFTKLQQTLEKWLGGCQP